MGGFERICWIVTILASIGAVAILGTALFGPRLAAPDQAVLAVVGAGIAIVPYVFTRAIQALGRDQRQRAGDRPQAADPLSAAEPAAEPARRETPRPSVAIVEEPAPSIAEPQLEPPAPEPARGPAPALEPARGPAPAPEPRPPKHLVAMERLVPPPPPPPRRSALEQAFWVLIGILVVIIVVGIILIRNGP